MRDIDGGLCCFHDAEQLVLLPKKPIQQFQDDVRLHHDYCDVWGVHNERGREASKVHQTLLEPCGGSEDGRPSVCSSHSMLSRQWPVDVVAIETI
ncbi:MAG: hypothetical protein AAFW97_14520 [Pseudomonadota bacterium]